MRFGILGPLVLCGPDGEPRSLPAAKERVVAAALICRANTVVSVDALVDAIWDDDPPRTAAKTLQTYISAVRRAAGADRITTRPPGYLLRVDDGESDAARFTTLADEGRRLLAAGDLTGAAITLDAALGLWRGQPFEEFADRPFFLAEATRLREARLAAIEARTDAGLALGDHDVLAGTLEAMVSEHPLRERFWAQLMLAQYRSGRQADALQTYQRARRTLGDQLGIDPGPELRSLEQAVLEQDPGLGLAGSAVRAEERTFTPPITRYASSAGSFIAYQTLGDGPEDLLYIPDWWSHVEAIWDHESPRRFLRRLAEDRRLVLFDSRGTGLSDPIDRGTTFTLEDWASDARAVLDTVGSRRVVLFSTSAGTLMTLLLAALEPHRVRAIVVVNGLVSVADTTPGRAGFDAALALMRSRWGAGPGFAQVLPHLDDDPDFGEWFTRFQRLAVSPGQLEHRLRMIWDARLEDVARMISTPTLVMHRRDNPIVGVERGRELAELIPDAQFVELAGDDHLWAAGDTSDILTHVEDFLDGAGPAPMPDRLLATLLVSRFEAPAGERARFDQQVTRQIERHRGRAAHRDDRGLVAAFDGPARALSCGWALVDVARQHGASVASGLHAGEIDRDEPEASTPTRALAEHAAGLAAPGEIVVTQTIVDLTAGSGHEYEHRTATEVAGVGGTWSFLAAPK